MFFFSKQTQSHFAIFSTGSYAFLQQNTLSVFQTICSVSIKGYTFRKEKIGPITTMHLSPLSCSKSHSLVRFPTQQENKYLPLFLILCPCLICFIICCKMQGKNKTLNAIPIGDNFWSWEVQL